MKAKLFFSIFFIVASVSLYAQDSSKLTKVFLQDGTTFSAYVEKQADGGYKLTTEDGSVFLFREGEVSFDKPFKKTAQKVQNHQAKSSAPRLNDNYRSNQKQSQTIPVQGLKYRDLKRMYSARDYYGYELGDKYSPAAMGISSFIFPGMGQYITGSQIGWGICQTYLFSNGLTLFIDGLVWEEPAEIIVGASEWLMTAIWSACSASKAAKIKNLYYRDLRNGVAYHFGVAPYVDLTAPVLASNQNFVTGLSLRVSF